MKYLAYLGVAFVAFWAGAVIAEASRPPPVTYIVKSDAPRCELIDRIRKRKEARL